MAKEQAPRRVSDVIQTNPWPDAERAQLQDIAEMDVSIMDARRATVASRFDASGYHDAYFVLLATNDGGSVQVLVSQTVLMDKLQKLVESDLFPIVGKFTKPGRFWDLV